MFHQTAAAVTNHLHGRPDGQEFVFEAQCVEQLIGLDVVGVEILGADIDTGAVLLEQLDSSARDRSALVDFHLAARLSQKIAGRQSADPRAYDDGSL